MHSENECIMELFKGQSLLEFTERFKTDLDCEEYLIPSSQRFFTHLQYLFRYRKSYSWNFVSQAKIWDNVKIILEEREVEESNWNNKNIGETKWTGKL